MSSRTLSAPGHSPSSPISGDRARIANGRAPLIGYILAGAASLLIWAGVLSMGLQILR